MNSVRVKAELILNIGEYLKFDVEVPVEDQEITLKELDASGQSVEQVSASSLLIDTDQPINTDILGGTPQTNVRFLIMLSEPV